MKNYFLFILFFSLLTLEANSQHSQDTVFFTKYWKRTANRDSVGIYGFKDYDSTGAGLATYYHKSGELHSRQNEINNLKNGECIWYYKNGNLKARAFYKNDSLHGTSERWFPNKQLEYKENYLNGKAHGNCTFYSEDGKFKENYFYEYDKRIYSYTIQNNDTIYGLVTKNAMYDGAYSNSENDKKILEILNTNLKYPKNSIKKGQEEKIWVYFIVTKDGKIKNMEAAGIYPELKKEALRVVKLLKKWSPAEINNKPVSSCIIIPVSFKFN